MNYSTTARSKGLGRTCQIPFVYEYVVMYSVQGYRQSFSVGAPVCQCGMPVSGSVGTVTASTNRYGVPTYIYPLGSSLFII